MEGKPMLVFSLRIAAAIFILIIATDAHSESLTKTPSMKDNLTKVIRARGFLCPEVKIALREEPDAYGYPMHVFCGPLGGNGAYPNVSFRVTLTPDHRTVVQPWK